MPDLSESADQFAKDIIANNIVGLMPVFTPAGMGKAMAMQAQDGGAGAAGGSTGYRIDDQGDGLLHITFTGDDGDGTIFTKWVDLEGVWKVDDMGTVAD